MYVYDTLDQRLVESRAKQFANQTLRYRAGRLSEDQFRPLRLQNGLYEQRFAPMLRVAIPYGTLSSLQLRTLADISERYDKSYAHFTTRQNVQFNWPELDRVPAILEELAAVEMHAIQTSGNCIRNTTTDVFAGVAADEFEDPRPWCEIIRQWSTLHPEFAHLPRKFKIAVSAAQQDRAASYVHDIGLQLHHVDGQTRFRVIVGGGLGRTPILGQVIHEALEPAHLRSYLEAILRVYNTLGRRDNKYKARIKILLKETGREAFQALVEEQFTQLRDGRLHLNDAEIAHYKGFFTAPNYAQRPAPTTPPAHRAPPAWLSNNVKSHKQDGWASVVVSLKPRGDAPGDATAEQMRAVAELADQFGFGEIRVSHQQNLVLPDVAIADLDAVYEKLATAGLATANIGLASDMICCPGLDFCALANAGSIGVANDLQTLLADAELDEAVGDIRINLSGCMNGCGHHSVGHIGILGVDKKGEEWYQITLGGNSQNDARLGDRLGAALSREHVAGGVQRLLQTYLTERTAGERFNDTYKRLGAAPFKEAVYA